MSDKLFTYAVVLKQNKELSFFAHKYDIDDGILTFYRDKVLIASFNNSLWETCYLLDNDTLEPIILNNSNIESVDEKTEKDNPNIESPSSSKLSTTDISIPLDNNESIKEKEFDDNSVNYAEDTLTLSQVLPTLDDDIKAEDINEKSILDTNLETTNVSANDNDIEDNSEAEYSTFDTSTEKLETPLEEEHLEIANAHLSELESNLELPTQIEDTLTSNFNDSNTVDKNEQEDKNQAEEFLENEEDYFADLDTKFKEEVLQQYSHQNNINEISDKQKHDVVIVESTEELSVHLDDLDLNDFDINEIEQSTDNTIETTSNKDDSSEEVSEVEDNPFGDLDSLGEFANSTESDNQDLAETKAEETQPEPVDDNLESNINHSSEEASPVNDEDNPFDILESLEHTSTENSNELNGVEPSEDNSTESYTMLDDIIKDDEATNIPTHDNEDKSLENEPDPYAMLDDIIKEEEVEMPEENPVKTKEFSIEDSSTEDSLIEQEKNRETSDIDSIEELLAQLPDTQENSVYAAQFEQGNREIRRVNSPSLSKDFDAMDKLIENDNKNKKDSPKEVKKSILEKVVTTVEKIAKIDKKFGTPSSYKEEPTPEFKNEPEPEIISKPKENPMIRNAQGRLLTPNELKIKKDKIIEKTVLQYCSKYDNFNPNNLYKLLSNNATAQPYGISETDIIWVATKMIKNYEVNVDKFSNAEVQNKLNFFLPNLMSLHWDGSMGNMYSVISDIPQLKEIILIDLAVWLVNNNY